MILHSEFRPSWWLRNPHLQTIWAAKVRRPCQLSFDTERLELPDGDFVDLAWSRPLNRDGAKVKTEPLVCLFHGLAGSINSTYVNRMIRTLTNNGFATVLMHFRGCSGMPNRLASSYHSGHTKDIRSLINTVVDRHPGVPVQAVGYSLGGNALLKYLGEEGTRSPLKSAIAISPPLVLQEGAKRMQHGLSRIYQHYLIELMREQHQRKRTLYPHLQLPDASTGLKNFWEFDNTLTAPLNGFTDVHDYYAKCSARRFLCDIRIPCHVLYSLDDPFFSPAVVPTEDELSEQVTFELTQHGGHVAFVAGNNPFKPVYWMEPRLLELLQGFK